MTSFITGALLILLFMSGKAVATTNTCSTVCDDTSRAVTTDGTGTSSDVVLVGDDIATAIVLSDSESNSNNPLTSCPESAWPYLDKFFRCKFKEGKTVKFECLLCKLRNAEISAYINSPSNLQKHIKVSKYQYSSIPSLYQTMWYLIF